MTEEEWQNSVDPRAMCDFVRYSTASWKTRWLGWLQVPRFKISDRRWQLLELATCEWIERRLPLATLQSLLPLARKCAEGRLSRLERVKILEKLVLWLTELQTGGSIHSLLHRDASLCALASLCRLFGMSLPTDDRDFLRMAALRAEEEVRRIRHFGFPQRDSRFLLEDQVRADLVREIIGNPFASSTLDPNWLRCNDGVVERLAREIDEQGRYQEMPILADALEDAGCTREDLLIHCRSQKEHVRGCWVLDFLLGRER